MNEYKTLPHMAYFNDLSHDQITYLSPHHGVLREDSVTTKLPEIFNCTAESSSGYSYNSIQLVSPTSQENLYYIIVQFRQHYFVATAEISKMYRQIEIADEIEALEDDNHEDEVQIYAPNTIKYVTVRAPFFGTRCLLQLAIDHEHIYPEAFQIIKKNMYVDDLLCGADLITKLTKLCQ